MGLQDRWFWPAPIPVNPLLPVQIPKTPANTGDFFLKKFA
jgi:hypothetical protein